MKRVLAAGMILLGISIILFAFPQTAPGSVPSLRETLKRHDDAVAEKLTGREEAVIREEWGEPQQELQYSSSSVLTYRSPGGNVVLYFTDGTCSSVRIEPVPFYSGMAEYPLLLYAAVFCAAVVPFALLMLIVSLLFRKTGWVSAGGKPKGFWAFTGWKGSRPWNGF